MARHLGVILAEQKAVDATPFGYVQSFNEQLNTVSRSSKQLKKAFQWIKDNDPDRKLTVRKSAKLAAVSVGTMHKAREIK